MLTDQIYVQGGFGDANGQPTLAGFDTFFDDSEIDATAHLNDALYRALRSDTSFLAFTVGNGSAPLGSGTLVNSEGETIGLSGDISFEGRLFSMQESRRK